MFIAHIPVGLCPARTVTGQPLTWKMILITSFGAVFPDLDLLRFYFVDNGQIHHHAYWTHLPAYWTAFIALIFLSSAIVRKPVPQILLVFLIASVSYLILDSVAGDIRWLWPLSDKGFHLVTVPASHTK